MEFHPYVIPAYDYASSPCKEMIGRKENKMKHDRSPSLNCDMVTVAMATKMRAASTSARLATGKTNFLVFSTRRRWDHLAQH